MTYPFSLERLTRAWYAYRRGKRRIASVGVFEPRLEQHLVLLAGELATGRYRHGPYRSFFVSDPKRRLITAAGLRDRIVHQVVFEEVERVFEPAFLDCSYSGRKERGVHAAVNAAERAVAVLRAQRAWPIYAIKLDVRKFYDSVDHAILLQHLRRRIRDPRLLTVITEVLRSHSSPRGPGKGIPIGNLTSQIFANVYLHELDRFAKHALHVRHYFRYADDMLLIGADREALCEIAVALCSFARASLLLDIPFAVSTHTHTHTHTPRGLEHSRRGLIGSEPCSGRTDAPCAARRAGGSFRICGNVK